MIKARKIGILLGILILAIILGIILVSYISHLIEIRSLQDVILKFIRSAQLRDRDSLREVCGGKVFVNLFSGNMEINEYYIGELNKQFPSSAQIKFLRIYQSSEFLPEEKRKYGFIAWKVNLLVIDEKNQYVGGYSFYVSKVTELDEAGNETTLYKILDILKVGDILF
ncbi:MAG: hypothetical protein ABDH28_01630 [Brevinematia bacterium]